MIVVDCQVLIYATFPTDFTGRVAEVRARDDIWVAPPLWRSEYRHVVAGYMRRASLKRRLGVDAVERAAALLVDEPLPDTMDILALVETSRCSAYDLEYVAVAQALGVPLVTNDKQILTNFPTIAVSLDSFTAGTA